MKVFLVNGSPHQHGCTDRALREVASALEQGGIETEIFWIGSKPIGGCIGCGACAKLGRCAFDGVVNEFAEKLGEADGFVFGSPVHYAAASGSMTSFLDRLFYSASEKMRGKPAAVVVSARRGGTTAQIPRHLSNAHHLLLLLEHGAWLLRRGGRAGSGGAAHHARPRPQHGLFPALSRGGPRGWRPAPARRAARAHQLHPLKSLPVLRFSAAPCRGRKCRRRDRIPKTAANRPAPIGAGRFQFSIISCRRSPVPSAHPCG